MGAILARVSCDRRASQNVTPFQGAPVSLVPRQPGSSRYYCVTGGPDHLLGIHLCVWRELEAFLPGGKLFGSGVQLKGHDSLSEAVERWRSKGKHRAKPWPRHF